MIDYLDIKVKPFSWLKLEDIYVSQQAEFTCEVAAFRMVLRYYNIDINETDLI